MRLEPKVNDLQSHVVTSLTHVWKKYHACDDEIKGFAIICNASENSNSLYIVAFVWYHQIKCRYLYVLHEIVWIYSFLFHAYVARMN